MRLTTEQIDQLFKFCEKHFVYFYEVQVELVDHLANAVELEMSQNRQLTFEAALDKVYAGFGPMGFLPVWREKSNQLEKRTRKIYWTLLRQQFHWPQILLFFAITMLVYTVLSWNQNGGGILITAIVLWGAISNIYNGIAFSRLVKKTGKKFMIVQYGYHLDVAWLWFLVYSQLLIHVGFLNPWVGGITTGLLVVFFSAANQLTHKIKNGLFTDFPRVFNSAN